MPVRLQKFIAESGVCSRRKAEDLIRGGHVHVNGELARIGDNVDPEKDEVIVQGQKLKVERKIYLMLNKPRGYITTLTDPWERKSVMELIHEPKRVFPVGRLDRDTTGLLLLTNDGEFANRIMHPRYETSKTYEALLDRKIEREDIDKIRAGVVIDGKTISATASRMGPKQVRIVVHTGLNKEVKRIFKALGFWVRDLHRVEVGGLRLPPALKEGKYRHLVESEIKKLGESQPKHYVRKAPQANQSRDPSPSRPQYTQRSRRTS
jgi:23S rRNA pseudouridine2605 synthase